MTTLKDELNDAINIASLYGNTLRDIMKRLSQDVNITNEHLNELTMIHESFKGVLSHKLVKTPENCLISINIDGNTITLDGEYNKIIVAALLQIAGDVSDKIDFFNKYMVSDRDEMIQFSERIVSVLSNRMNDENSSKI